MGTELRKDNLSCMLGVIWGAQRENWGLEAVLSQVLSQSWGDSNTSHPELLPGPC